MSAKLFRIESSAGVVLGVYEGENEQQAFDALARDAGYRDHANACQQCGDLDDWLTITEVTPSPTYGIPQRGLL